MLFTNVFLVICLWTVCAFQISRPVTLFFLQPEKCWEADLKEMASQINDRTKLIVVINPSNPCGSVYTKEHLEAILAGTFDGVGKEDGVHWWRCS